MNPCSWPQWLLPPETEAWVLHPICAALRSPGEDPQAASHPPLASTWAVARGHQGLQLLPLGSLSRRLSGCWPGPGPSQAVWPSRAGMGARSPSPLASVWLCCFCGSCRAAWFWGPGALPHPARPAPLTLPCPSAQPSFTPVSPAPPRSVLSGLTQPCSTLPHLSPALQPCSTPPSSAPPHCPLFSPIQPPSALLLPALPCRPGLLHTGLSTAAPGPGLSCALP